MKSAVLAAFLMLPVALAQQVNTPTVTHPTVAVAPSSAGLNGGGAATGGISFVTRRTSMATPVLAGAAFFGAAGVPVVQGGAVAVPTAVPVASSPTAGNPGAVNALVALAAGGNAQAREALRALRAAESRTPASSGR